MNKIILAALFLGILTGLGAHYFSNGGITGAATCTLNNEPCECDESTCKCGEITIDATYCRTETLNNVESREKL